MEKRTFTFLDDWFGKQKDADGEQRECADDVGGALVMVQGSARVSKGGKWSGIMPKRHHLWMSGKYKTSYVNLNRWSKYHQVNIV